MNRKANSDTALLFRSLEKQAGKHPVRAIRLPGSRPEPLGLLFIDDGIPAAEVASALARLRVAELTRAAELGNPASGQSAAARSEDSCQVTIEERTLLWRQPPNTSRAEGISA
ncbi:MAG TPA: hypothetical protein DEQ20_06965 [Desulfobulbaceae bacterium]|nr:MAG: hypothetical protein A2520_00985 [Deltaproteobacteria bacterium RIFOXYD12_FULL_53_23]HCC54648.1 hypothetical protein [Desulfobulbaceae bacterium]